MCVFVCVLSSLSCYFQIKNERGIEQEFSIQELINATVR